MFIKTRNNKLRSLITDNRQLITAQRAFTLIELLVVVAIIGVLAAIVIINLTGAKASSRYAKTVSEMTEMTKSVNVYKETHNDAWPEAWSGKGDGTDGDAVTGYIFNNNTTTNIFLKDMYNGQIPTPECAGAKYAFYIKNLNPPVGSIAILYFPVDDNFKGAVMDVGGGVTAVDTDAKDIRDKVTKRITCQETHTNFKN